MAWIGKSQGIFKLHDSDNYCGSYLSIDDAAEVLEITTSQLTDLPIRTINGQTVISELDLHKAWGTGKVLSPHKAKHRNISRSLDELIMSKLLQITLTGCIVDYQI